jgi:hypothetical protein
MKSYYPVFREQPKVATFQSKPSAWGSIPTILKDLIVRFKIKGNLALDFGVDYGYSTTALSNYFKEVVGVDTFEGNITSLNDCRECNYKAMVDWMGMEFPNVTLVKSRFENFIDNPKNDKSYDLIHVDLIHDYKTTYDCGKWAIAHSNCVIFHDTFSFKDVRDAVNDLSVEENLSFWNYPYNNGLGILVEGTLDV